MTIEREANLVAVVREIAWYAGDPSEDFSYVPGSLMRELVEALAGCPERPPVEDAEPVPDYLAHPGTSPRRAEAFP